MPFYAPGKISMVRIEKWYKNKHINYSGYIILVIKLNGRGYGVSKIVFVKLQFYNLTICHEILNAKLF